MTVESASESFFFYQTLSAFCIALFLVFGLHAAMGSRDAACGALIAAICFIAFEFPQYRADDFAHPLTVDSAGTIQNTAPQIDDPADGPNTLVTTSTRRYLVAGLPLLSNHTPLNKFTYRRQPDHLCSATACYSILSPP